MDKIIRVTGEGVVSVPPDTICVSLSIRELDSSYSKSLEAVDKKVTLLKESLAKVGVDEKNVVTQDFRITQRVDRVYQELTKKYKDKFLGYETSHLLEVRFDYDTNMLGDVVNAISKADIEPRLDISFEVKKGKDEINERALKMAVDNAEKDAKTLAVAAKVKLGDILSINHSFSEVRVSRPAPAMMAKMSYEEAAIESTSLRGINVDDIKFNATVTIDWEIEK